MPVFGLQLKATLENVEKLYAPSSMYWRIKFSCLSCNEVSSNAMEFSAEDQHEAVRGTVNLVSRCNFCRNTRSADILSKSNQPYQNSDQPKFKTIIQFDCRGMQPVEFVPGEGWIVEASDSGEQFDEVDLTEGEWVDYDTKEQRPVGIYSLEHKFVKES